MALAPTKLITADEFSPMSEPADGSKEELVRGVIVTMPPPGFLHGLIQLNIAVLLRAFLKENPLGRVTVESGVQTESEPDTVRGPDVAYWSFERLAADQCPHGYPQVRADLCVEIRSPDQSRTKLAEKAEEYLNSGVRIVWVADPRDRSVTAYQSGSEPRRFEENETLTGEDVLPGFTCRVSEFFE